VVTIRDVAKKAGVSVTTVSRVLNNSDHPVNTETRAKIEAAIKELGYYPNAWARHLITGRTSIIGLMVPDITNPYYYGIARGAEAAAHELGYATIMGNTDRVAKKAYRYLELLREKRVEGIIIAGGGSINLPPQLFVDKSGPTKIVLIGRHGVNFPSIRVDNVKAAREATDYLLRLGHQRIAIITGMQTSTTSIDRLEGYRKALEEAGINPRPEYVVEGDFTAKSGYEGANRLLSLSDPPTAIVTVNDLEGLGAVRGCLDRGLRVPDDVSIVGFDRIEMLDYSYIRLTSVDIPTYEIGRAAVQMVVDLLHEKNVKTPFYLPTKLVLGESCGPPP